MLTSLFAHGVGSRGDLPLPLWQFAWAAMAALVISFMALGVLWKSPRLAALSAGIGVPGGNVAGIKALGSAVGTVARIASFGLFVLVLAAGLFGVDDANSNIAPFAIFVILWVGFAVVASAVGNAWDTLSPFSTVGLLSERVAPPQAAPAWSSWLAPLGAFLFLTLELVHPEGSAPRLLGIAMTIYSVVMVIAVVRWGRAWLRHGEMFAALFHLLGAMAPIGRNADGVLRLRAPLSGLSQIETPRSSTALLLVVLGGTSFDGFAESEVGRDLFAADGRWAHAALLFAGLIGSIVVLSALYLVATRFSANVTETNWGDAIADFTPSLVPIVLGYTVAHYAQLLIDETQTFVFLLSDPLGQGLNIFGGADNRIDFNLVSVDLIAWVQALGIVVGHIAAVIVAHDRAMERYSTRDAARSQYAMLFAMVIYSVLGLWLLLNA